MAILSRIIKKAASSIANRNYSSAIFVTPLKNGNNIVSSSGGDLRISIPTLHFFSSVSSKEGGKGDDDLSKAEEPNASVGQTALERPDIEDLDEMEMQQAFNEKNQGSLVRSRSPTLNRSSSPGLNRAISRLVDLYGTSTYVSGSPYKNSRKRSIKKINLPTHYCEVNYRTLKAVVFYGPNIDHIPHGISKKDLNLLGVHQAKP
ncbi:hypothetical protein MKX01_039822 [Papaver californicum]|nr:hypothetical protein MKX01_039822 [Papaver californicum]